MGREYRCPACRSPLSLKGAKDGARRRRHFAHRPNITCAPESIIHKTAKLLVQRSVNDWKLGIGPQPVVKHRCTNCNAYVDGVLPSQVEGASIEQRLPDGYVVDVALLARRRALAAVEIRVTHPVGELKGESLCIPFIELEGQAIIEDLLVWYPIVDRFSKRVCAGCVRMQEASALSLRREAKRKESVRRAFQARCEQLAREMRVALPTQYYRYAPTRCRRCQRVILVFDWSGHRHRSGDPPSGSSVPRTIRRWVDRRTGEIYWLNSCPHCRAIQWVDQVCEGIYSLFGRLSYVGGDSVNLYRWHMLELIDHWGEVHDYYVAAANGEKEAER